LGFSLEIAQKGDFIEVKGEFYLKLEEILDKFEFFWWM
jgi:hypothetical protein